MIMSPFRNFDLNRVLVDIMASRNITNFYDDEIGKLGSSHRYVKTLVYYASKRLFERYGDLLFSCSDLVSQCMYIKKIIVL